MLLPVDVPSRDVGRALADDLNAHGMETRLLDPSAEEWAKLPTLLLSLPAGERGPLLVLGPREKTKELLLGIQRINLMRNRLIKHLNRPLLWCGQSFFLEVTWDGAPDFWSVRDITQKIPLREDSHRQYTLWWDPFVRKPPPVNELEARIADARRANDRPNLLRALLSRSKALIALGRAGEAVDGLNEADHLLETLNVRHLHRASEEAEFLELKVDLSVVLKGLPEAENQYQVALEAYQNCGDDYGRVRVLGKLGLVARNNKDSALAKQRFAEALDILNRVGDDQLRAELLLANWKEPHDWDVALHIFAEQGDDWGRGRALCMRGRYRHDCDDFEGAAKDFDEAIPPMEQGGDIVGLVLAYHGRAELTIRHPVHSGRFHRDEKSTSLCLEKAIEYAGQIRHVGSLIKARKLRARYRSDHNDYEGALEDYAFALENWPDPEWWQQRVDAYIGRHWVHYEQGNHKEAIADLKQAMELNHKMKGMDSGNDITIYARLCHIYAVHLKQPSEAEPYLRELERLVQQYPNRSERRASFLMSRGEIYEGHFREQMMRSGEDELSHALMMQYHREALRDYGEALAMLGETKATRDMSLLHFRHGSLYALVGNWNKAIEALTQGLKSCQQEHNLPRETEMLVLRAGVYLRKGALQRAARDLNKARVLARSPKARRNMGFILLVLGELELCRGHFAKAASYQKQAEQLGAKQQKPALQAIAIAHQARLYLIAGYAHEARMLALKALELVQDTDNPEAIALANQIISQSSLNPKDLRKAVAEMRHLFVRRGHGRHKG